MPESLLAPGAVLALWTLIMLGWVAATRFPALAKAGLTIDKVPPGVRGIDAEPSLPPEVNWKSHNYTHLLEQPTLFYAVIVFLHLSGGSTDLTRGLAWTYVVVRIVHSFWQAKVNRLPVRIILFTISTLCLLTLAVLAVIATLG